MLYISRVDWRTLKLSTVHLMGLCNAHLKLHFSPYGSKSNFHFRCLCLNDLAIHVPSMKIYFRFN